MNEKLLQNIKTQLLDNGWENRPIGFYEGKGHTKKPIPDFDLYLKIGQKSVPKMADLTPNPPWGGKKLPDKWGQNGRGQTSNMGHPEAICDPTPDFSVISDPFLGVENYPSLVACRPDSPTIMIGYDSEWENLPDGCREVLSWQFSFYHEDCLVRCFVVGTGKEKLTLDHVISFVLGYLGESSVDERTITRYSYCTGWDNRDKPIVTVTRNVNEAYRNAVYAYIRTRGEWSDIQISDMPDKNVRRWKDRSWSHYHKFFDFKKVKPVSVTLIGHALIVDLTTFDDCKYILTRLSSAQGGLFTQKPIRMSVADFNRVGDHKRVYPVSLNIRDTMTHAPAGKKSLEALGDIIGVPKISVSQSYKEHMLKLATDSPVDFAEYACQDAVIALEYPSTLYGYNNRPPVTLTSAFASAMKKSIMGYLRCADNAEFDRVYRGLKRVVHGLVERENRPGYVEASSLEPISDKANTVQNYASLAYHGGYNSCSEVGYFPFETYDYDLKNAYPTAMCLVPDIDWSNPIRSQVVNRNMSLQDFHVFGKQFNPVSSFVGYCRFSFPESVKYPCIPVNVEGVLVYPRTSDGLDGVYIAGPHVYLAIMLGAEVYCENGYFMNSLLLDGEESRSLANAVRQLVIDRNRAIGEYGKGSIWDLFFKTGVNSGYGKTAQNVVQKHTWNAYSREMDDIGCSAITNPFSAMMTTAIVQCELLAGQNQIHEAGYSTYSTTTDGFITNCPEDVLKSFDLYGFRNPIEQSRYFLSGDTELWERKHYQDDLVNFTTRGNVSLQPHGVCAHNSAKSGYESDSYEDRLWLMTQVLSRNDRIVCQDKQWDNLRDIIETGGDFRVHRRTRRLSMDFDLKRKPLRSSFSTDNPIVEGKQYEIAHFDTEPFETITEFQKYRAKARLMRCLRTQDDWRVYFLKVDTGSQGIQTKDMEWAILMSVIMGYRAGMWDIPGLSKEGMSVEEKCVWINQFNNSKKKFNTSHWKNARRPSRQVNMLPKHFLEDKLKEMGAIV